MPGQGRSSLKNASTTLPRLIRHRTCSPNPIPRHRVRLSRLANRAQSKPAIASPPTHFPTESHPIPRFQPPPRDILIRALGAPTHARPRPGLRNQNDHREPSRRLKNAHPTSSTGGGSFSAAVLPSSTRPQFSGADSKPSLTPSSTPPDGATASSPLPSPSSAERADSSHLSSASCSTDSVRNAS